MSRILYIMLLAPLLAAGCSQPVPRYDNIFVAIAAGDLRDVRLHLRRGTPLETRSVDGLTPLAAAVAADQVAIARDLLLRGAVIRPLGSAPGELMIAAVIGGDSAMVQLLLDHGQSLYLPPDGEPVLSYAVMQDNLPLVEFLLRRGGDLAYRDGAGRTYLHFAAAGGAQRMISWLLARGFDPDAGSDQGTPLLSAAVNGHLQTCTLLLDHGADPCFTLPYLGMTAADFARQKNHRDLAEYLDLSCERHQLQQQLARPRR